jgi:transcription elongation factor Elf1
VGDETDSICPRCDDETIHRVVAMKEKKIHLVLCRRCNSQHRYRPSLATITRKVPLPSERQAKVLKKVESAKTSRPQVSSKEWKALKEVAGEMEPLPYDSSASYSEKQIVSHRIFGLGFVRKVIDKSKIEVVFEYEVKILAMNRKKSQ